jgi:hypothetical protein
MTVIAPPIVPCGGARWSRTKSFTYRSARGTLTRPALEREQDAAKEAPRRLARRVRIPCGVGMYERRGCHHGAPTRVKAPAESARLDDVVPDWPRRDDTSESDAVVFSTGTAGTLRAPVIRRSPHR